MWLVASNNYYYPDIAFFSSYEQAKEFYDITVKECKEQIENDQDLSIVIAEVNQMATNEQNGPGDSPWYLFDRNKIEDIKSSGKTGEYKESTINFTIEEK